MTNHLKPPTLHQMDYPEFLLYVIYPIISAGVVALFGLIYHIMAGLIDRVAQIQTTVAVHTEQFRHVPTFDRRANRNEPPDTS